VIIGKKLQLGLKGRCENDELLGYGVNGFSYGFTMCIMLLFIKTGHQNI